MRLAARDVRMGGVLMLGVAAVWPLVASGPLGSLTCPLLATTGVPCPLCGMTTSVVATTRLDFAGAVAANPFGPVAVAVVLWLLVDRSRRWLRAPSWVWATAAVASWLFQLTRFT